MKITSLKSKTCLTVLGLALAVSAQADDQKKLDQNRQNPDQSNKAQSEQYRGRSTANGSLAYGFKANVSAPTAENKASSLIGMAVKDQSGEKLGDIKDIVLDIGSGRIAYAVFGTDGKERLFALPLSAFKASADHDHLIMTVDKAKFENIKGFDKNSWPALNTSFQSEVFWETYGSTLQSDATAVAAANESDASKNADQSLTPTGKDAYSTTRSFSSGAVTDMNKASKLIGMNIKNSQNENLGEIKDIVLDLHNGRVAYAVMGFGGTLGVGQKMVAVPLNAFTFGTESKNLVLNADKSRLESTQGFEKNNWPSVSNPTWGADKFWEADSKEGTTPTGKSDPSRSNQNQNQNNKNQELKNNPQ